jgi:DNA (cytosine-5)-methyltransferase 1
MTGKEGLNELALFAGAGGGILGGKLLGWRTVCAVEIDGYCRKVLMQRQDDGILEPFPVWDDVRTFDGRPWLGIVDVVSGGFPCQDISAAGKGAGIGGERSGLWGEMARIIGEVRPRFAFVENSPLLVGRGLSRVLADLAAMGYDARWGVVGAVHAGAPHKRERIWIVANDSEFRRREGRTRGPHPSGVCKRKSANQTNAIPKKREARAESVRGGKSVCNPDRQRLEEWKSIAKNYGEEFTPPFGTNWWDVEPEVGRVVDGVASRVDRLRALGNGQVPAVVALAWRMLGGGA